MNLHEYQDLAKKTVKWRGTEQLDADHMIIGMFSEINEMIDALKSGDIVNIKEELGDISWYTANYATVRKISISQQTDVGCFGLQEFVYLSSKLSDHVKKWMIYNKEMDGVVRNEEIILVQKLVNCICNFSPSLQESDVININEVWDMNISKLQTGKNARYKDAVYSDEAAKNRNLEGERKTLEGDKEEIPK